MYFHLNLTRPSIACNLLISVVLPTPQSPTITNFDILDDMTDLVTAEIVASLHTPGEEEGRGKRGGGRWSIVLLRGR